MDTTLDSNNAAVDAAISSFGLPLAAAQAFAGATAGLVGSGLLVLRTMTNMFAIASGAAGIAGAMRAFQSHAGDGIVPDLDVADAGPAAAAAIDATERLARAWGANLQVSPTIQAAAADAADVPSLDPADGHDEVRGTP